MKADLHLIEYLEKFDINTEQGAIGIYRCFREHEVVVYWGETWEMSIAKSKNGAEGV